MVILFCSFKPLSITDNKIKFYFYFCIYSLTVLYVTWCISNIFNPLVLFWVHFTQVVFLLSCLHLYDPELYETFLHHCGFRVTN